MKKTSLAEGDLCNIYIYIYIITKKNANRYLCEKNE